MEEDGGERIRPRHQVPHYHGDHVRALFLVAAIVLIVAQSTGVDLPVSTFWAVTVSALLVVVAGVTNPAQKTVHWLSEILSVWGTIVFGISAVNHYRAGVNILDGGFLYVEALAILFLLSLYFTTKTLRGLMTRTNTF